jgi:integrase
MTSFNFTKSSIDALPLPLKGWQYHRDTKTPGLAIGVGVTGIRTFVLYRRINGDPERVKLGRYPGMTIEQARTRAAELNGQIAMGKNPADAIREKRGEMTLDDLFDLYLERYAIPHGLKTLEDMKQNYAVYFGKLDAPKKKHGRERVKPDGAVDWSKRQISTITHKEVSKFHHQLGTKTGKTIANRMVELLRAVFNRCKKLKLIDMPNPAEGLDHFKEIERDRYLNEDEIPRLFLALETETEQNRDYFLLLLLTGARKSNVLSMRWKDIDFNLGHWRVPGEFSKNGNPMIVPLTVAAKEILTKRKEAADAKNKLAEVLVKKQAIVSEFVFAGTGVTGHMTSPKGAWKRITTNAEIQDVHPHDLRRSLGSWMVNTGASIPMVGGALGHKDSASTLIYARLATATIKGSMEVASAALMEAGKPKPKTEEPNQLTEESLNPIELQQE